MRSSRNAAQPLALRRRSRPVTTRRSPTAFRRSTGIVSMLTRREADRPVQGEIAVR